MEHSECACKGIFCDHKRSRSTISIGSKIASALKGTGHGVVDFVIGSIQDLQTAAVYIGSSELEMSLYERRGMIEAVEQSQANQMDFMGNAMMGMMSIGASNSVYQSFRSKTTLGLEVASLIAGGYGAVKGVISFSKLVRMPGQVSKVTKKSKKFGLQKIDNAASAVEDFLGRDAKIITNADGDMILMQGNKKVRFDVKDPHGDKPHFHLEQRTASGRWVDAWPEHRYYFTEE